MATATISRSTAARYSKETEQLAVRIFQQNVQQVAIRSLLSRCMNDFINSTVMITEMDSLQRHIPPLIKYGIVKKWVSLPMVVTMQLSLWEESLRGVFESTGEKSPFWVSALFASCANATTGPLMLVHKGGSDKEMPALFT